MKYLCYAIKKSFNNLYVVLLNGYYWCRFYYKAKKGYFNKDFSNQPTKDGWIITFQDEFEGSEIVWDIPGGWNKWYSEKTLHEPNVTPTLNSLDCIEVKDNQLHLYTKKNENYPKSSDYPLKTGLLNSGYDCRVPKGFEQQYGYYETSCKVPPNGSTFWPAFWLYGNVWPPEIDIFEFMSIGDVDTDHSKGISMTTHWGTPGKKGMKGVATQLGRTLRNFLGTSVNFDEHFHIYACKWEWNYIEWYIDNVAVYRTTYNIPDNKMSVVINNGAKVGMLPKDEQMPQDFIINYVRVYEKNY